MLTDNQIRKHIENKNISIDPFDDSKLRAGKYNVHLGSLLLIPKPSDKIIDPTDKSTTPEYENVDISKSGYVLKPGEFLLGQTLEKIGLGDNIGMLIDGSTTIARLGITIHQSATYLPPGQDPHIITLEIYNAGIWNVNLSHKMKIGKLVAFEFSEDNKIAAKSFNPYNGQAETTGAIF